MSAKPAAPSWRRTAIRIGGSALMLGLLLVFVPLHKLGVALRSVPASLWVSLVLGYLATHMIGVIKWRLTLRLSGARLTFAQAVRCYYAGLFGTVFLPSVVGGDVVRMAMAFRVERNKACIVLGSLVDRILDILSLAMVAGVGALLLPGALEPRSRGAFKALAVGFALIGLGLFVLLAIVPWRRLPYKMSRLFVKLRRAWLSMASRPAYVLISLSLGIVVQFCLVALSASVASACGLHISFHIWLIVWPLAKILALMPLTLGGVGIREAGLTALLAPFGAPPALTVAAGLCWEAILIAGGLAAGLVSLVAGGALSTSLLAPGRLREARDKLILPPAEYTLDD